MIDEKHPALLGICLLAAVGCAGGPGSTEDVTTGTDTPIEARGSDTWLDAAPPDDGGGADAVAADAMTEDGGDETPPQVEFIKPLDGAEVEGAVFVEVDAQDDTGVVSVELFVDGEFLAIDEEEPYEFEWDATDLWSGTYLIEAVAVDAAGNTGNASISVTVLGECDEDGDCPPTVGFDAPAPGAFVHGEVEVKADADDDDMIVKVRFLVDGGLLEEDAQVPYKVAWDTTEFDDGSHAIEATAFDSTGKTAAAVTQVTVDNTPPEVSLITPEEGVIQHDEILLSMEAADNLQMDRVEFVVDDGEPSVVSEEPWELVYDASALLCGLHIVEATAFDAAGNEASVTLEFLVDRPPAVAILAPEEGALVPGAISVQAQAEDDVGLDSVALYVDGAWLADLGPTGDGLYADTWIPPYEKNAHLLSVVTTDSVGQESEAVVMVMVDYPITVALLFCDEGDCEPLLGEMEVSGVLALKADAQDDGAEVIEVDFLVDDELQHQDTEAPFDYLWGTNVLEDGTHTVKAVAWNSLEQKGETEVVVQVNNCDLDHDDFVAVGCGGPDCDDGDAEVNPSALDLVGNDTDENCDGMDGVDADADGYASVASGGDDCDDEAPLVHPCGDDLPGDGVDGNCDGEDVLSCDDCVACVEDIFDGDACIHTSQGDGAACDDGDLCTGEGTCDGLLCLEGSAVDCNDDNPCTADGCLSDTGCWHLPLDGAACPDGVCIEDTCCFPDCAGKVCGPDGCGGSCGLCDEALLCCGGACASPACSVENEWGECLGIGACVDGAFGCEAQIPAAEACNGLDDDCDGQVDEGYPDQDLDGDADCMDEDDDADEVPDEQDNCPLEFNPIQSDMDEDNWGDACDDDVDGDGALNEVDCAPTNPAVYPFADEVCNGVDDDCDGVKDDGFPNTDGDALADCIDPDDDNDFIPDVEDNCPWVSNVMQSDFDNDNWGDACDDDMDADGVHNEDDCAPLNPFVFPGADEVCNGQDDNCDGEVDEGCITGCGGDTGLTCPEDEFCLYPDGTCGEGEVVGECMVIPLLCPLIWDPVCGCDGQTYANVCSAWSIGVSLLYEVECTAACEGVCDDGSMCTMDDVCVDGVCLGTPVDCGDGIDCTVDTCDELVGCVHTPDDAFCASDNPCVVGVCAPDTEGCIDSILEDGTPCGGNSTCIEGQCVCLFPDCEGKVCGDDGCGGSCGECAEGLFCAGGICVETPPGKYMRVTWFLDGQIMPVVHGGISGEILQLHTWWGNHAIKVDLDNDGSIDFEHPDTYPDNQVDAVPYIGLPFSDGFGLLDYNLWTDYWVDDTHGVVKCWSSCSDKAWGAGATFYVDDQGFACDSNEWKYNGVQVVYPPLYCIQWDTCGDGQVAGDETCDDYNRIDGDGCSADCLLE